MKKQWYEIVFHVWKHNSPKEYSTTIVIWLGFEDIVQEIVEEINKAEPVDENTGITLTSIETLKTNGTKKDMDGELTKKIEDRLSTSRKK